MYICICKSVTDHQIRKAVFEDRVSSMRELRRCLGACDQCGKCATDAHAILRSSISERTEMEQACMEAAA
ncbi:(2Fe-2S)-binding protein [Methylococcus sp. EFPC2]|uniref:(2Fe-2S)-binding protein n=1 Tax=Methylococcus sp. EFPC2 TaxID=2812648 RepID=UPI001967FA38|nr:(2Fe-2S)-binding protein [Methylococcus sp. EFPC2]QSA98593.1 (2Fe-2S)-binding protein [Methylococcus sp. EFPC2]